MSHKYLFAEPGKKWTIGNWSDDMELLPGVTLNLEQLLETALGSGHLKLPVE